MKNRIRLAAIGPIAVIFAMALATQAQPRQGQTAPAVTGGVSGAALPVAKIALVNTDAFLDEKQGISRLVAAVGGIEREFSPQRTELQQMQDKIKALANDIAKTQNIADPNALRTKQQQGEALQREYEYKAKDAQAAYQKKIQERAGPINEDIGKALDAFAKQRGITLILDVSKLAQVGAILTANESMDVTRAFIADYNSRSPR